MKTVFREKETVDTQLAALKKELHMKDIYLKQLGAHNVVNAVPVDQDHLQRILSPPPVGLHRCTGQSGGSLATGRPLSC